MKPGKKIYPMDWLGEWPYGRMSEADALSGMMDIFWVEYFHHRYRGVI